MIPKVYFRFWCMGVIGGLLLACGCVSGIQAQEAHRSKILSSARPDRLSRYYQDEGIFGFNTLKVRSDFSSVRGDSAASIRTQGDYVTNSLYGNAMILGLPVDMTLGYVFDIRGRQRSRTIFSIGMSKARWYAERDLSLRGAVENLQSELERSLSPDQIDQYTAYRDSLPQGVDASFWNTKGVPSLSMPTKTDWRMPDQLLDSLRGRMPVGDSVPALDSSLVHTYKDIDIPSSQFPGVDMQDSIAQAGRGIQWRNRWGSWADSMETVNPNLYSKLNELHRLKAKLRELRAGLPSTPAVDARLVSSKADDRLRFGANSIDYNTLALRQTPISGIMAGKKVGRVYVEAMYGFPLGNWRSALLERRGVAGMLVYRDGILGGETIVSTGIITPVQTRPVDTALTQEVTRMALAGQTAFVGLEKAVFIYKLKLAAQYAGASTGQNGADYGQALLESLKQTNTGMRMIGRAFGFTAEGPLKKNVVIQARAYLNTKHYYSIGSPFSLPASKGLDAQCSWTGAKNRIKVSVYGKMARLPEGRALDRGGLVLAGALKRVDAMVDFSIASIEVNRSRQYVPLFSGRIEWRTLQTKTLALTHVGRIVMTEGLNVDSMARARRSSLRRFQIENRFRVSKFSLSSQTSVVRNSAFVQDVPHIEQVLSLQMAGSQPLQGGISYGEVRAGGGSPPSRYASINVRYAAKVWAFGGTWGRRWGMPVFRESAAESDKILENFFSIYLQYAVL